MHTLTSHPNRRTSRNANPSPPNQRLQPPNRRYPGRPKRRRARETAEPERCLEDLDAGNPSLAKNFVLVSRPPGPIVFRLVQPLQTTQHAVCPEFRVCVPAGFKNGIRGSG